MREGTHVVLSEPVEGRGEDYYRAAVAQGLEGVMAKRKDSPYKPGIRSGMWLKIKAQKSCDCVIAGYTPGREPEPGLWGPPPWVVRERPAGPGRQGRDRLSTRLLVELMERFAPLVTVPPQPWSTRGNVVWLEPVLVCEVAYQEVTRDRKLRIPRFIRLRADKPAATCTDRPARG